VLHPARADRFILLFDLTTGRPRLRLSTPWSQTRTTELSPDGTTPAASTERDGAILLSHLATSGNDGTVRIWKVATGDPLTSLDGRCAWLPRVVFSADGRTLAAAGFDNPGWVGDMDDLVEVKPNRPEDRRLRVEATARELDVTPTFPRRSGRRLYQHATNGLSRMDEAGRESP